MTTTFILTLTLFAILWAVGNAFIHRNYLYLEHAKVAKYLEEIGETDDVKLHKDLAHLFWFFAMAAISAILSYAMYCLADKGREIANGAGAALYCIGCFWGLFGGITKWVLNGTPFYLGDNRLDSLFKFPGGKYVLTAIQAAAGIVGVVLLN